MLTQALGKSAELHVQAREVDLLPGDRYLLCSDGLTGELTDAELAEALSGDLMERMPEQLVELANAHGGRDNVTALVVFLGADARRTSSRRLRIHLPLE